MSARRAIGLAPLLAAAILAGCTRTQLVSVPPRIDLARYGTLGVVDFASNAGPTVDAKATREFQQRIHAAQPGTPLLELGPREKLLAAAGAREFDAQALRKIGAKYGVDAVFLGEIAYSDPQTEVQIKDLTRLEGSAKTTLRGDMSARLLEARSGASVWSSGAWATRTIGGVSVSAERGVSGGMREGDPRELMVPAMLDHLTEDFRPSTVKRRVE
ncbi:MAG: hypothetical protein OEV81_05110 [Betaproteobacteria bacterium]|nr:hypothetical protein [Betaproteobacteria bacterium]MDH5221423.1 hypothetical protein [Betaproteobacteria bacterium]MDH5351766.1 hypothetical protein [Betaproteobacteria bacterium]